MRSTTLIAIAARPTDGAIRAVSAVGGSNRDTRTPGGADLPRLAEISRRLIAAVGRERNAAWTAQLKPVITRNESAAGRTATGVMDVIRTTRVPARQIGRARTPVARRGAEAARNHTEPASDKNVRKQYLLHLLSPSRLFYT